jgi:GMP synthase (glutamine-hydrolysing)
MSLRVLLLQAREPDDPMAEHEHRCFADATGLGLDSIRPHDLCEGPPPLAALESHDAVMVGGSGAFNVSSRNLPQFDAYLDFLREVAENGHPAFLSCYGYQSIVAALGGRVIADPDNAEVGTFEMTRTDEGRDDPLFGELPERFMAQVGHKDRADRPVDGLPNLVASERSPYQALRIPGKPVWATQFHPELDRETNLERLMTYWAAYGPKNEGQRQAAIDKFKESRETSRLLPRFLRLVFG